MDSEEVTPQEGDYTLTPCGPLGSRVGVAEIGGKFLGDFPNEDEAIYFIRQRMIDSKCWANVWNVSDHGNWTPNEG